MKWFQKFIVPEHCLGVLIQDEQFIRVLPAGVHRPVGLIDGYLKKTSLLLPEIANKARPRVAPDMLQFSQRYPEQFTPWLQTWKTAQHQVGLFYQDGVLTDIMAPGSEGAFWLNGSSTEVCLLDIEHSSEVEPELARILRSATDARFKITVKQSVVTITVPEGHIGFLLIDGQRETVLAPGVHVRWSFNRDIDSLVLDTRLQNMEVNGQEILTSDKVALRVNLSATWRVIDARLVMDNLSNHTDYLYRELQLALRTVVSTRSLDELLDDKNLLNAQVRDIVAERAAEFGLELRTVGVRDIVLPGDMKEILTRVVEAQKRAEANLIHRREETQATRSLLNTAKVMEGNPTLLRLKELEVLEKVSTQIGTLNVYGGLNGVMNDLVSMTDSSIK